MPIGKANNGGIASVSISGSNGVISYSSGSSTNVIENVLGTNIPNFDPGATYIAGQWIAGDGTNGNYGSLYRCKTSGTTGTFKLDNWGEILKVSNITAIGEDIDTSDAINESVYIAAGSGKFIVLGNTGTILTSPDGVTWIARSSGVSTLLTSSVYANSKFVTVGYSGTILTSPDGITWTTQTSGTSNNLAGIVFGSGKFVVAGSTGTILTSPDGITWTTQTSGATENLIGFVYGNNKFVTGGGAGTILTSPDAITWTPQTSGTANVIRNIVYANNKFVAVGFSGTILTSPDGITWTTQTPGTSQGLQDIIYIYSKFIVVGDAGTILTSPDAITWTPQTSGTAQGLFSIIAGSGKLVAAGNTGTILTSPDGITWTPQTSGTAVLLTNSVHNGSSIAIKILDIANVKKYQVLSPSVNGGAFVPTDAYVYKTNFTGTAAFTDGSGAGLTLNTINCELLKSYGKVLLKAGIIYPSTIDATAASIRLNLAGFLVSTSGVIFTFAVVILTGGTVTRTVTGTLDSFGGGDIKFFDPTTGTQLTNTDLSGKILGFSVDYITTGLTANGN